MTAGGPFDAVLVLSFGGPSREEEVRPFLQRVLRDRPVSPERFEETVEKYMAVGGASPLTGITRAQAESLEKLLLSYDRSLPVYVGMRNWHPFIKDTLERMSEAGVRRALGVVMVAHRSEASTGRYEEETEAARAELGGDTAPEISYVSGWHEHELFIDAISARIREALDGIPEDVRGETPWIFTAHSIPLAQARASTYVQDISRTIELVAERFSPPRWRLAYQSRSGPPEMPWLGPDVHEAIREEAGASGVLVIPVGFVADNVEIIFDLDRAAAATAREAGLVYHRAGTVGDHPAFIRMLAEVVREAT